MIARMRALLPFVILLLAAGLRYYVDPAPVQDLRLAVFDEYQRIAPRAYADAPVRVVAIDDESLARLGQWPWPRTQIAGLVRRLGEMGAAAVVFDIVFAEPDRTSPRQVLPLWAAQANDPAVAALADRLSDHDQTLAQAMAGTPTVLGFALNDAAGTRRPEAKWGIGSAGDEPAQFLLGSGMRGTVFRGAVTNLPVLEAAAAGLGVFNIELDRDGLVRRLPLLFGLTGGEGGKVDIYPSLIAEALRVAQGASTYIVKSSDASGETALSADSGVNHVKIGELEIPTDKSAQVWLYDSGQVAARTVPAWRVLEKNFDPAQVDGRIVLIGASAAGLLDLRATPLDPQAPGVTVNAQVLEQILLGQYLERPDWTDGAEIGFLLIFGAGVLYIMPRRGALWCAGFAVFAIAAAFASSWGGFRQFGVLSDPLYPSLAVLMLYLVQSMLVYLRTEGERRQVRQAFSRYMSPDVVEMVARNPALLQLGGVNRDMTVLFSDVRNFTKRSERLDAGAVTQFLNRFLTPMTDVILKRNGTIDKYMGDAIMAFWNAPLDNPDHTVDAARAALDMLTTLDRLNAASGTNDPIAIGIGLNSGTCCVGNFGSEQRLDYSVVGDNVNLASRLEGQSKNYGVTILIGEATQARLPGFACLELDRLKVKGREQPVAVFALLGDEATAREPWFVSLVERHNAMLAAYRARDWDIARVAADEAGAASGGRLDRVYDMYAERIAQFRVSPPPEGWTAVIEATEK
jgi:adenylate cyclase